MGAELLEAWNNPKFICIDRSPTDSYKSMQKCHWCWHPRVASCSFDLLQKNREEFFMQHKPDVYKLQYSVLKSIPGQVLSELCTFLHYRPTTQQMQQAVAFVQSEDDDFYV